MKSYGLTIAGVAGALNGANITIPTGLVHQKGNRYFLTADALAHNPDDIAAMKLLGFEFNMVTLTAVIVAVGLLTDDAIVVIENIERHIRKPVKGG